jgi:hypothetical protein
MGGAGGDGRVTTLLFVYNADDGLFAAIGDAVHKLVSPDSYPCSLCAITYGAVRMRPEWRAYLRSLPYPARFLHRGAFARAYPGVAVPLPAILLDAGHDDPRVLVDAGTLDRIDGVEALIAALDTALSRI